MKRGFRSMLTPTLQQAGQTQICSLRIRFFTIFQIVSGTGSPVAYWLLSYGKQEKEMTQGNLPWNRRAPSQGTALSGPLR